MFRLDRLTQKAQEAVQQAQSIAEKNESQVIYPVHLLAALLEERDPFPNVEQSANWTSVGICAHQSALKGGKIVNVPDFSKR